jgi:hypothetical protein
VVLSAGDGVEGLDGCEEVTAQVRQLAFGLGTERMKA